ncbi:MAG TPA: TetR/AcrR family transcriptional regulator, partial [Ruminococcaceae bacterium]|nr:TetR/AcrR family transcriptional regulator [Oscillospiraceae bacterium]
QEDTKQRILSESLRLFSEKGYDAVSVAEIATAVGIKAPSLYKHYKSKRDIFDSILKKMSEADSNFADENDMPNIDGGYERVMIESIRSFSIDMFKHWTCDEFSARFRRMLSLERFKNPEMAELYKNYISSGPLDYMIDVFVGMNYSLDSAKQLALSFYAPMYLLYTVYDESENKEEIILLAEKHINNFIDNLKEKSQ